MDEKKLNYNYAVEQEVSVNGFFDVKIGEEVVRLQITSRYGSDVDKIKKTVMDVVEAYGKLRETYPAPYQTPDNVVVQASQEAKPESGKYDPKPLAPNEIPEELPQTSGEGGPYEYFKEDFDEIEISPQPDGKADVKFYRDNLKFPLGVRINKWKHDSIRTALQALGDFDPSQPLRKRIAGCVFWTEGKEYTNPQGKKGHYHDLKLVQARF